jgi:hypothetical protein
MNVRLDSAQNLLRGFARLEFTLLKVPQFIDGKPGRLARIDWDRVSLALAGLPETEFVDRVPQGARAKMLAGGRNRPKRMVVREPEGAARFAEFDFDPLPEGDAAALLEATKRVRNNLFHGGKEDPRQQPYDGDDQEWCNAANQVLPVLLDLDWGRIAAACPELNR